MEVLDFEVIVIGERLRQVRKFLKLSQTLFGQPAKITQDAISDYEKGKNVPNDRTIDAICKAHSINKLWLEYGDGEMFTETKPSVAEESYLDGEIQEQQPSYYVAQNASQRDNGGKLNMWVIPAKAQAGFVKGFSRRIFTRDITRTSWPMIQGECFMFEIEGFSMYPDYLPNDHVVATILNDWPELLRKEKIYVFQTADGLCVKQFEGMTDEEIYLKSSNNNYNPVAPLRVEDIQQVYNIELKVTKPQ